MWPYVKAHLGQIVLLLLFAVIFAGVFALYHLEAEAVVYASILCVLAGSVFFAAGYVCFLRRKWLLRSLRPGIALSVSELPEPMGPIEAEYQELLRLVQTDRAALAGRYDRLAKEQEDYYAAWAHQIKTPIAAMGLVLQKEDTEAGRPRAAEEGSSMWGWRWPIPGWPGARRTMWWPCGPWSRSSGRRCGGSRRCSSEKRSPWSCRRWISPSSPMRSGCAS